MVKFMQVKLCFEDGLSRHFTGGNTKYFLKEGNPTMKRILALVLAVMLMATLFVGCGGSGDNGSTTSGSSDDPFYGEDNISLKVWAPDAAVALTQKQCDAFKALYPNKTISIEVIAQGESDAATNLLNDPSAAADVFGFACDQLNKLEKAGVLSPVSDYPEYEAAVKARDSEESIAAATLNGKLLAYPETGDNGYYLVYDKRYVTDEDAKTLEGVFAACKKAGKNFVMDAGNGFYSCMFPFTGGLKITGLEGEDDTQVFNEYDADAVADTLVAFATLFHDNKDNFLSGDVSKVSSGMSVDPSTVAAGIDGSWNAAACQKALGDNYGAAKLPTIKVNGEDKQIISMHGYKLMGVNKSSKFPESAQLLANYLTDEECQKQRAEEISWGPSNKNVAASDVVKNNVAVSAILAQSAYSIPQVNISSTFWNPMADLGNNLFKDGTKYDKDTLKKLLQDTVTNIKDE